MNAASAGHPGPALDSAGRQLDQVRLVGISAIGHHGVFEHERREGQTFRADVVAHLDTRRAAATDDLAHTLHYGVLAEQIAGVLSGEPVDLIETVAERIAATVLAHTQVVAVDVAVHKPQPDTALILVVQDNLAKGASGQAVQNMNLMFGMPETTGLGAPALLP
ncbi:putative dihydroneopterin aldolase [mine drainage metagenome]|uniref:dihydroneopterin aldolase n=1 Tax=mine drainage metagenome TaxID=410659 RepID=A0A1J5QL12_9ZZZZ